MPSRLLRTSAFARLAAVLALVSGCALEPLDTSSSDPWSADDAALEALVLDTVATPMDTSPSFGRVNEAPYPTELHETDLINVFVPRAEASEYARIDPTRSGSGASLARNAVIVREVWAAAGPMARLTVMVKGPPGYFPDGGDYFYGVLTPDGTRFEVDDLGVPLGGRLASCARCHWDRRTDDFLFGVPPAAR